MKNTRTNTLKLRKQSIRTLTASELRAAAGGAPSGGRRGGTSASSGTSVI
jgi:hypothetical protein